MVLTFEKNQRAYVSDLNNLAYQHRNAVRSGCAVIERSPAIMGVRVETGVIFFGVTNVGVTQQDVAITASDPNYDRIDLVVVDNTGTVSVIDGTAEIEPHTPDYDPELYVVLARVFVDDLVLTIVDAKISDLRVLNEFGYGAGGVSAYLHNQGGSSAAWSVAHNLNELNPLVWVFDASGDPIEPESITITDANNLVINFGSAITGQAKILGGQATTYINSQVYRHDQSVGSTTWVVPHALGIQYVIVQVYNSSDVQIIPDSITLDSANQLTITFSGSITGTAIVQAGEYGGGNRYLHTESPASASWSINHALNEKYVTVMVYDTSDQWVIPDSITLTDADNLVIAFSGAVDGKAVILR